MTIPTQKEWVEGCLAYYRENDYEPGNPEDGEWQVCHYPVPKCLGGEETIHLLKEHHAVQGVLQSEEQNHPCVWGWERNHLEGELLALFNKWMTRKIRMVNASISSETRRKAGIKGQASKTPEQRSEIARRREALKDPEQRKEQARKAAAAAHAVRTLESRRAAGYKAWETRRKKMKET